MPSILITDKAVRTILARPAPPADTDYTDELLPGFVLRHYRSGRAGYGFRYLWQGKARRLPLGLTVEISADDAREKAVDARRLLRAKLPRDPAAPPPPSKIDRNVTLQQAVELWHADQLRRGRVTGTKRKRVLERHILSRLGTNRMLRARDEDGRVIDNISTGECLDALRAMQDGGLKGAVTDAQTNLHGVFAYCKTNSYLDANPLLGVAAVVKPRRGERALDIEELATVWRAAEHLSAPTCAAIRVLIALGQRCGEVAKMRHSELIDIHDLKADALNRDERRALVEAGASLCWVLPVERQKSRHRKAPKDHIIPLPPQVIALIEALPRWQHGDFVFSHCQGRKPFGNWTEIRAALYKHAALDEPWTPRDLRASLVTGFANHLETMTGTAGRLCNHAPGKHDGVTGEVYERSRRLAVVYRAACRWAVLITAIVDRHDGKNILPLPAQAS